MTNQVVKVPVYSSSANDQYDKLFEAIRTGANQEVKKILLPDTIRQVTVARNKEPVSTYEQYYIPQYYRLRHVDVNIQEVETGYTPLLLASKLGNKQLVHALLVCSASVNCRDDSGNSSLHIAVMTERPDIMDLLICNKADVNVFNKAGNTPLHIACKQCKSGNRFIALKLLKAGANVFKTNKEGYTALDLAAMQNSIESVSLLLESNPDLALRSTLSLIEASTLGHSEVVELLLNYGMEPNFVHLQKGTGPLHEAIRNVWYDVVRVLLAFGANPDLENRQNETPRALLAAYPPIKAEAFIVLLSEYENRPRQLPLYADWDDELVTPVTPVLIEGNLLLRHGSEACDVEVTSLLENERHWTNANDKFCNSFSEMNPNTNILDGDPCSFWLIPQKEGTWVVFDFGSRYTLSGIRIYGWDSPQMIRTVHIQISRSGLDGSYVTVASFVCRRLGCDDPADPAAPQDFHGFRETSRYWRLLIVDGHGGRCMCFQGVQFYGYDREVWNFFKDLDLEEYALTFINHGFNKRNQLAEIAPDDIAAIIQDEEYADKVSNLVKSIEERRSKEGKQLSPRHMEHVFTRLDDAASAQ